MLKIEKSSVREHVCLHLLGEVDASNSVELDESIQALISENIKNILVDGKKLEYISSAGLGVFMSYLDDFAEKDISLVIFGLNQKVQQVFHILGLDQLITIRQTEEEAMAEIYEG
jgi:anti-sigma B factor antagonist